MNKISLYSGYYKFTDYGGNDNKKDPVPLCFDHFPFRLNLSSSLNMKGSLAWVFQQLRVEKSLI